MGVWMKSAVSAFLLCVMALGLGGCGSAMRGYLDSDTPEQTAAVRQDLTMPPDLRLPPPGAGGDSVAPVETASAAAVETAPPAVAAPAAPRPSASTGLYEQYGISLYKPDGTKKTERELQDELRAHHIEKKKQANPNYGTIANIGNIFKDE